MKTEVSTIITPFTSEVNGIGYEYTATQLAEKKPHCIEFTARRDSNILVRGSSRPVEGNFYFETTSPLTAAERMAINNQINTDLAEVEDLAKSINIVTAE